MDLYVTQSRQGRYEYFTAPSFAEARRRAIEVAGKSYRYISVIRPESPLHKKVLRHLELI
jgi:hypothetical protein